MWIKTVDLIDGPVEEKLHAAKFAELAGISPSNSDERFARAAALVQLGRFAEARDDLTKLREEPRLAVAAALELAMCELRGVGGETAALALIEPVIESGGSEEAARPRALHLRALVAMRRVDMQSAVKDLLAAADGFTKLGNVAGSAQVNDSLGTCYMTLGQIDHALGAYARSLADKTVLGDRQGIAITLGNLGRLSFQSGRYGDALHYFTNDLLLARQLGDVRGEAKLLNDVGRVLAAEGKTSEALAKLDEGLALAKANGLGGIIFFCLKDKADTLAGSGDTKGAMAALSEARALLPAGGAEFERLLLDLIEAETLRKDDPKRALELAESALQQLTYIDVPDVEIQARLLAADLYRDQDRTGDASAALLLAVKRCRARGLTRYLRTLSEAMARYGVEEGVSEEAGRAIGWRPDEALSGYFIREELGSGSFGTVYRAFDLQRGKDVALKLLQLDAVYDRATRDTFLDSLRLEIEAAARARHPGVAEVYAIGRDALGNPYIVQQFVSGRQLRAIISEGSVKGLDRICNYMAMICHGVGALHRGGVIHRDLKPENVVVTDAGAPILIDFGIAHVAGLVLPNFQGGAGTRGYAPPEQGSTKSADPKLDMFPLGIMAWEWFSGARPEKGRDSIPDPAPKKKGWFGGAKEVERSEAEIRFLTLVREMLAPAEERLGDVETAAHRFEQIRAYAEQANLKAG
ncbi:Serine/threonine-protein kinase PknD [Alphaproteobacteria bacterium SO-S41]|nr:Serine/threonine-protein kinase PknD [Alphaproteobacteria bacterium SO-S41]